MGDRGADRPDEEDDDPAGHREHGEVPVLRVGPVPDRDGRAYGRGTAFEPLDPVRTRDQGNDRRRFDSTLPYCTFDFRWHAHGSLNSTIEWDRKYSQAGRVLRSKAGLACT